jgi:hypothetical protein
VQHDRAVAVAQRHVRDPHRPADVSGKLHNPTDARYVRVTLTGGGEERTGIRELVVTR